MASSMKWEAEAIEFLSFEKQGSWNTLCVETK